jgi:hypothetical protein
MTPVDWSTMPLQSLDPHGAGLFTVRAASDCGPKPQRQLRWALAPAPDETDEGEIDPTLRDCWLLQQGGISVGLIKRAEGDNKMRTASEEWRVSVCRKRLGWQIAFARLVGQEPPLRYLPDSVRLGGCVDVLGERRYKLRAPLLRPHWRLLASSGDDIARFAFRRDRAVSAPRPRELRALGANVGSEPLLPVVLLAAAVAIVVHSEQPSGGGNGGGGI